jgi:signal transduction histidine kinase
MDKLGLDALGPSVGRSTPTTPGSPPALEQSPSYDATVRFLRLLLIGIVVIPVALAMVGGYATFQAHLTRTEETLVQSVADAAENTVKVLDTHRLVAARIDDLLAPLSDRQIRDQEQALHVRLSQQIEDLPQIAAAWALDANGRELVSAKVYPVDADRTHSDREDFKALKNSGAQIFIWALRARNFENDDFRPYFTVARRRESADGQFRGITIVAISGTYLASFFNSLLGGPHHYSAGISRDNGTNLASFSGNLAEAPAPPQPDALARAIASGSAEGLIVPGSPFARDGQITAYRRVGNYPIYISLSRSEASVLQEWLLAISGYFAIAGAAVFGLLLLCLMALRRAHREQTALIQARSLLHDRNTAYEALRVAKEEADEANQAKTNFLATMSHELRTPLNAIIGFSEMIMREELGPVGNKKYHDYISDIYRSGTHLLQLISDILDLSKASAGKLELKETVFDLHDVMRSVRQITGGLVDAAGLSLDASIPENLPLVRGDQRKMRQVLLNLINNSIKFTAPGGEIIVSARLDPSQGVILTVSDTGLGIAPEDIERVTRPFEQAASPLNGRQQGTGLGLPLVKEIVEQHNGRLELNSELDAGTTVSIILPPERTVVRPLPMIKQDMAS